MSFFSLFGDSKRSTQSKPRRASASRAKLSRRVLFAEMLEDRRMMAYAVGSNLISNGGAESDLAGWFSAGGEMASQFYGAPGGFPGSGHGSRFFYGGDAGESTIFQDISLSGGASQIDLGLVRADLSAHLGGFDWQGDHAILQVQWLNGTGGVIRTDSAPTVTAENRGGVTTLLPRSLANIPLPAGTRTARVVLQSVRHEGTANDGYADNLSLVLEQVPAGANLNDDVFVPGTLAVDVGSGTVEWSGNVSGGGTVVLDGSGTVNITSSSFAPGSIVIIGATINVQNGGHVSTSSAQVRDGGSLAVMQAGTLAIDTTLSIDSSSSLEVDGTLIADQVSVAGTWSGTGNITSPFVILVDSDGSPGNSPGILKTRSLTAQAGAKMRFELNGTTAGSGYDRLDVTGTVTLNNPTFIGTRAFSPALGQSFVIIANDGSDAVNGQFSGLSEGEALSINGQRFHISYRGGTGNDVELTRNSAPTGATASRSVLEDVALSSSVTRTDPDGDSTTVQLVGSGPSNESQFTLNPNGTFTYTPRANWSGSDSFQYRVSDGEQTSATYTITINVTPVADVPTLSVQNATGNEAAAIPLVIGSALTDTDGSETLSIRISGVPAGVSLSAGTTAGGGIWTLTPAQLSGLTIRVPDNAGFTLTVQATAKETANSDTEAPQKTLQITVNNVKPTLTVSGPQTTSEGAVLSLTNLGTVTDPGYRNTAGSTDETFTYSINWGDGTATDLGSATIDDVGSAGDLTNASFDGSHIYADNGTYTVTVRVTDDDGLSDEKTFLVSVNNVAPTLAVAANQTIDEGALLSLTDLGTFTDPGFDNGVNPNGPSLETFSYSINWGDGTSADTGAATRDVLGDRGLSTAGSFDGSHIYADNGTYTVTVRVTDDDGLSDEETFLVTVNNVAPTLAVVANQTIDEGALLSLTDLGTFTDPGFDNGANPHGASLETFTYSINWGDGTSADTGAATRDVLGDRNLLTEGSFDGSHIYADNGTYTVTVRVTDDDGLSDEETFQVTVANVAPTLAVAANQTIDEGALLSLTDLGTFTDPGFDNGSNPHGASLETFSYSVNWGDGTSADTGAATRDVLGDRGLLTAGSFDGSHIYADNGTYTVTVRVTDDDGDFDEETFQVTVNNVAPTLAVAANQTIDEGALLSLTDLGTFTDPGFDNGANPNGASLETFSYSINWGDGTSADTGAATRDVLGDRNLLTKGSFDGSHIYADNGTYTVTVRVTDDDGLSDEETFLVLVNNVNPTIDLAGSSFNLDPESNAVPFSGVQGQTLEFDGSFADPGFDNSAQQLVETFTYVIQWGDGTANATGAATIDRSGERGVLTEGSLFESHVFTAAGSYSVTLTIIDDDGGTTQVTKTVTIADVAMQQGGHLAVGGTMAADNIHLKPASGPGIEVSLNGLSRGSYSPSRILVFGQAGDDDVQVSGSVNVPAWIYGGSGDDRLKGGNGNDVLLGGDGADLLQGGSGQDLMIGGQDADRLVGNADDDILIAGSTEFDENSSVHVEALRQIMAEWTSGRSYSQRVANLSNGTSAGSDGSTFASRANGETFLWSDSQNGTVFDDNAADVLTGSAGQDWFLFNTDGEDGTVKDKATDLHAAEFQLDLDWLNNGL